MIDIFRPLRYLYYRLWGVHSEQASLKATGLVLFLISLNEMTIFGDRWIKLVEHFCGVDSSKWNVKLWILYGVQMVILWFFLERNADRIVKEFKQESAEQRKWRGILVWIYVIGSVSSFLFLVFLT